MKILVVENDPKSLENIKSILIKDGYEVFTALKARDAIETLKNIDSNDEYLILERGFLTYFKDFYLKNIFIRC